MKHEDCTGLTKEHFDSLPPLVPLGSDREQILNELVEAWATKTQNLLVENKGPLLRYQVDQIGEHAATLKHIDIRDDNPGALPINLGDLLQEVQNRTPKSRKPTPPYRSAGVFPPYAHAVVAVIGCRIRKFRIDNLDSSLHIALLGSQFDEGWIGFRNTFNGEVNCVNCSFLGGTIVQKTTFKGISLWCGSTFESVSFSGSVFECLNSFTSCQFNQDAKFSNTWFRSAAGVSFNGSKFNKSVSLPCLGGMPNRAVFKGINFRKCDVSSSPKPLCVDRSIRRWRLRLTDWINWRWVRTTGNLTALTRVSYLTLAGVPLIAGL